MKVLVEALVETVAFIEMVDDNIIDPDSACKVLEQLVSILEEASLEEKEAILTYCAENAQALKDCKLVGALEKREFYLNFGADFGLLEEEEN